MREKRTYILWNASFVQNDNTIIVTNESYNSIIKAKGMVSFGFNLSYSGINEKPSNFILNNTPCIMS